MALDKCNCKSDFQDKRYGVGVRVFTTRCGKTDRILCTICGAKHPDADKTKGKK